MEKRIDRAFPRDEMKVSGVDVCDLNGEEDSARLTKRFP